LSAARIAGARVQAILVSALVGVGAISVVAIIRGLVDARAITITVSITITIMITVKEALVVAVMIVPAMLMTITIVIAVMVAIMVTSPARGAAAP